MNFDAIFVQRNGAIEAPSNTYLHIGMNESCHAFTSCDTVSRLASQFITR